MNCRRRKGSGEAALSAFAVAQMKKALGQPPLMSALIDAQGRVSSPCSTPCGTFGLNHWHWRFESHLTHIVRGFALEGASLPGIASMCACSCIYTVPWTFHTSARVHV